MNIFRLKEVLEKKTMFSKNNKIYFFSELNYNVYILDIERKIMEYNGNSFDLEEEDIEYLMS